MDFFKRLVGRKEPSQPVLPVDPVKPIGEEKRRPPAEEPQPAVAQSSSSAPLFLGQSAELSLSDLQKAWKEYETESSSHADVKRQKHALVVKAFVKAYEDEKIPYYIIESRVPSLRAHFPASVSLRLSNALISTNNSTSNEVSLQKLPHASSRAVMIERMLQTESLMLRTLFILAQELPPDEIDPLVETGLPSCLVNLYASLLHLPPPNTAPEPAEFHPDEMVVTILLQLCTIKSAVLELQQTDSLFTLFTIPLTELSPARVPLRERIMPVTFAVVKYHMDIPMVSYLMKRKLIDKMLGSLDRASSKFSAGAVVDLSCLLLKVLERSAQVEHEGLLLEFRNGQGYPILTRTFADLEARVLRNPHPGHAEWAPSQQLLAALSDFVYVGVRDLTPQADLAVEQLFGSPDTSHTPKDLRRRTIAEGEHIQAGLASMGLVQSASASALASGTNPLGAKRRPSSPATPKLTFDTPTGPPDPSQGQLVRNIDAYQVFQDYFMASESEDMKQHIIEYIAGIYNSNPANFRIVQHLHSVAHFIEDLPHMRDSATRESVTRLLLFIITGLGCVPFHELVALAALLQDPQTLDDVSLLRHLHHTLLVIIKFDPSFRIVLNKAGLLDILIVLLRRFQLYIHSPAPQASAGTGNPKKKVKSSSSSMRRKIKQIGQLSPLHLSLQQYSILTDMLVLLLQENSYNVEQFKDKDAVRILYDLISSSAVARPGALHVLTHTIQDTGSEREGNDRQVARLVEVMQTSQDLALRKDVLEAFSSVFATNPESRRAFRDAGGCVCAVSALVQLEGALSEKQQEGFSFSLDMLHAIFRTVIGAIRGDKEGRIYMRKEIGFRPLAQSLAYTGIFDSDSFEALSIFLNLATEHIPNISEADEEKRYAAIWTDRHAAGKHVLNPDALIAPLDPLGAAIIPALPIYLHSINDLIEWRVSNAEAVASVGLLGKLIKRFAPACFVESPTSAALKVKEELFRMLKCMLAYKVSVDELQQVFAVLASYAPARPLLDTMFQSICKSQENAAPFLYFDLSRQGCASMTASIVTSWPPSDGFTLSLWFFMEQCPPDQEIDILRLSAHPTLVNPPTGGSVGGATPNQPAQPAPPFSMNASGTNVSTGVQANTSGSAGLGSSPSSFSPSASMRLRLYVDSTGVICSRYSAQTADGASQGANSGSAGPHSSDPSLVSPLRVDSTHVQPRKWYHIMFVHERSRFQGLFGGSSENKVYVDGTLAAAAKVPVSQSLMSVKLITQWGTPTNPTILFQGPQPRPIQWRLGPAYVMEGAATYASVLALTQLGPSYYGHFTNNQLSSFVSPDMVSGRFIATVQMLAESQSGNASGGGYAALKELGQLTGLVGASGTAGPLGSTLVFANSSGGYSNVVTEVDLSKMFLDTQFPPERVILPISSCRLFSAAGLLAAPPPTSDIGTTPYNPSPSAPNSLDLSIGPSDAAPPSVLTLPPPNSPAAFINSSDGVMEQIALSHAESVLPSTARVCPLTVEGDARQTSVTLERAYRDSLNGRAAHTSVIWDCGDDSPVLCIPAPLVRYFVRHDIFDAILALLRSALSRESADEGSGDTSDSLVLLNCIRLLLFQNAPNHNVMNEMRGWELLGWFLQETGRLTAAKLQVSWALVGVPLPIQFDVNPIPEQQFSELFSKATIANPHALRWLILDFQIWRRAPLQLQLALFQQLDQLVSSSIHSEFNICRLRKLHFLPNLANLLRDDTVDLNVQLSVITVIKTWLREGRITRTHAIEDDEMKVISAMLQFSLQSKVQTHSRSAFARRMIRLRNEVLNVLLQLLCDGSTRQYVTPAFSRHIDHVWLHTLISSNNSLTVLLGIKILCELFRLDKKWAARYRSAGGLKFLFEALPKHHDRPELYFSLLCLLLGRPIDDLTRAAPVEVGCLDRHVIADFSTLPETFARKDGDRLKFACKEALNVIFHMLRRSLGVTCSSLMKSGAYPAALSSKASTLSKASPNRANLNNSQHGVFEMDFNSGESAVPHSREAPIALSPEEIRSLFPQKQLFDFLRHLFTLSKHFQEALWKDKSEMVEDLVGILFPLGRLNLLRFSQQSATYNSASPRRAADALPWEQVVSDPLVIEWSESMFDFLQHIIQTIGIQLEAGNISFLQRPNKSASLSAAFASSVTTPRDVSMLFNLFEWSAPASASHEDMVFLTSRLLADTLTLWMTSGGAWLRKDIKSNVRIANSISRFLNFAVDRCSMGLFPQEGHHVLFEFAVDFLSWSLFDETAPKIEIGPFLRVLNRLVLMMIRHAANCAGIRWDSSGLQLQEPDQTSDSTWNNAPPYGAPHGGLQAAQVVLDRIISCQRVVFAAPNTDFEFLASLAKGCYFLLSCPREELRRRAMSLWKLLLLTKPEAMERLLVFKSPKGDVVDLRQQGFSLLLQKDFTAFQKWVSAPSNRDQMSLVLEDSLSRFGGSMDKLESTIRLSRTQQMDNSRRLRIKAAQKQRQTADALAQTVASAISALVSKVQDTEQTKYKQWRLAQVDHRGWVSKKWQARALVLCRDRNCWGPWSLSHPSPTRFRLLPSLYALEKWCLDDTETPTRMRTKLLQNFDFFDNYPFLGDTTPVQLSGSDELASGATRVPTSKDSRRWWSLQRQLAEAPGVAIAAPISNTQDVFNSSDLNHALDNQPQHSRRPDVAAAGTPENVVPSSPMPILTSSSTEMPGIDGPSSLSSSPSDSVGSFVEAPPVKIEGDEPVDSDIDANGKEETTNDSDDDLSESSGRPRAASASKGSGSDDESSPQRREQTALEDDDEEELAEDEEGDKLRRLLEGGDEPLHTFNCGRIHGMDKYDGIFIISKKNIYFIQYYCLNKEDEVVDVDPKTTPAWKLFQQRQTQLALLKTAYREQLGSNSADEYMGYVPEPTFDLRHEVMRWSLEDIVQFSKRRYLLRSIAVELFSADGRNALFAFSSVLERDTVCDRVMQQVPQLRKEVPISQLTEQWVQGHISNFEYLMKLNTKAGRSYNDLTQYPVFPWVLNDYSSTSLDLSNPSIYRDLSVPMGAIDPVRREKFMSRYENLDDDVPRFHYGSHYSSAGIVLHYLIRLEPFTQHFLKLQGGRFDHPDRLFHSVQDAWMSASCLNTMDVKELVPEFYYQPSMFLNSNMFDFGKKQSTDQPIGDVVLPPWAHGSPHIFVRKMRAALESDYVSQHLHHWIDLIFGYKQTGDSAAEAMNLFYYLTYEGAVDIDAIENPTERQGVIDQINNFGQTPSQLFRKPHPRRHSTQPTSSVLISLPSDKISVASTRPVLPQMGSIGALFCPSGAEKPLCFERRRLPMNISAAPVKSVAWGYDDGLLRLFEGEKVVHTAEPFLNVGQITSVATDSKYVVCGTSDGAICLYHLEIDPRPRLNKVPGGLLVGHTAPISALCISRAYSLIVSADRMGELLAWDLNTLLFARPFYSSSVGIGSSANLSASSQRTPFFELIKIHEGTGDVITVSGTTVTVWSVNGSVLATKQTSMQQISAFAYASDGTTDLLLATGHRDGSLRVWKFVANDLIDGEHLPFRLDVVAKMDRSSQAAAITAIIFSSSNRRLWLGDAAGMLHKYEERFEEAPNSTK